MDKIENTKNVKEKSRDNTDDNGMVTDCKDGNLDDNNRSGKVDVSIGLTDKITY